MTYRIDKLISEEVISFNLFFEFVGVFDRKTITDSNVYRIGCVIDDRIKIFTFDGKDDIAGSHQSVTVITFCIAVSFFYDSNCIVIGRISGISKRDSFAKRKSIFKSTDIGFAVFACAG